MTDRFISKRDIASEFAFEAKNQLAQPSLSLSRHTSDTSMEDQSYEPNYNANERRLDYQAMLQSQVLGIPDDIVKANRVVENAPHLMSEKKRRPHDEPFSPLPQNLNRLGSPPKRSSKLRNRNASPCCISPEKKFTTLKMHSNSKISSNEGASTAFHSGSKYTDMSYSNEKLKRFPHVSIEFMGDCDDNESEGLRKLDFD